jgi:hypothetical protein
MGYLPEDQVAWLERALMAVGNPAIRDELTQIAEAAFATGYALGFRRCENTGRTELIRRMVAHLLDDIAAEPEPKTLTMSDRGAVLAAKEPPTAKVKRTEFNDSALSVLDQDWKPSMPEDER